MLNVDDKTMVRGAAAALAAGNYFHVRVPSAPESTCHIMKLKDFAALHAELRRLNLVISQLGAWSVASFLAFLDHRWVLPILKGNDLFTADKFDHARFEILLSAVESHGVLVDAQHRGLALTDAEAIEESIKAGRSAFPEVQIHQLLMAVAQVCCPQDSKAVLIERTGGTKSAFRVPPRENLLPAADPRPAVPEGHSYIIDVVSKELGIVRTCCGDLIQPLPGDIENIKPGDRVLLGFETSGKAKGPSVRLAATTTKILAHGLLKAQAA